MSGEDWDDAVAPVPVETGDPNCVHEKHKLHLAAVWVEGAAIAAIRCSGCGAILGTGSDG